MVNISFNKKDIYSNGIQRLLNPFSEEIGKYIIKEKINTSQNLVINLNEEFTITIDNSFKEEPEPKTTKQEISRTVENVKKLPVTGM